MDLKERDALGDSADTHWYYVSKAKMVARHFPQSAEDILDVGAGLGWFSHWFLNNGYGKRATCVDPGYKADRKEKMPNGNTIYYMRSITEPTADVVLLMDVLEHVDDDVALLKEYWEKAATGTVFIITVPAFEFLWSAHDDYLEHRRRYTCTTLEATIRAAGAEPERIHYFFGSIFPIALAVRLARRGRKATGSDMAPVSAPVNGLLTGICSIEARLCQLNRMAGLSVVAQFTKPAARD